MNEPEPLENVPPAGLAKAAKSTTSPVQALTLATENDDIVAYNYRMTNICAAIGLAQLEQADVILEKKRQIALWYEEALQGLPLEVHREESGTTDSFWMCSVLVNDATQRDGLRQHLREQGVETRPVFYPAHTMPHCQAEGVFPVAEYLGARGINLPSYPALFGAK